MDTWVGLIITSLIGLATGLGTGFYFEHRQTKSARAEAMELRSQNAGLEQHIESLQEQVRKIQTNVTTHIGGKSPTPIPISHSIDDVSKAAIELIHLRMNAKGEVTRSMIVESLCKLFDSESVDAALESLSRSGDISLDSKIVRIRA